MGVNARRHPHCPDRSYDRSRRVRRKLNPEFPMVNKIVELQLIGRQHPVG
jgi:hypothetical protein